MKNRYTTTFSLLQKTQRMGFCPFAVLGDPNEKECIARIDHYLASRPDFLELGIPFSDPVADGPTIQAADERALKSGMTTQKAFALIKKIRALAYKNDQPDLPLGILVYAHTVIAYGTENFCRSLKQAGADSVLIADVPLEESAPFANTARANGLEYIFLASDYTNAKRLKKIEKIGGSTGFLYVVSTLGTTGARAKVAPSTISLVKKLRAQTKLPLMVGFGISAPEHLAELHRAGAHGGIVGSHLVSTPTYMLESALRRLAQKTPVATPPHFMVE